VLFNQSVIYMTCGDYYRFTTLFSLYSLEVFMRFLTATWSMVASLVVVLAMFSFAPVALGDPWSEGYTAGKEAGKKACKTELSKCISKDSASSNTTCKDCLPDGYFVTTVATTPTTGGQIGSEILTKPGDPASKAWISAAVDSKTLLDWRGVSVEREITNGYITWGYFYRRTEDGKGTDNPEIFVKVYRDKAANWTNFEFFFVSVGEIEVKSCMDSVENCTPKVAKLTEKMRYVQHHCDTASCTQKGLDSSNDKAADKTEQPDDFGDKGQQVGEFMGAKIKATIFKEGTEQPLGYVEHGSWGIFGTEDDPVVFVKLWQHTGGDIDGRIDVNFFHTSPYKIKVSSGHKLGDKFWKASSEIDDTKPGGISNRYSRHQYNTK